METRFKLITTHFHFILSWILDSIYLCRLFTDSTPIYMEVESVIAAWMVVKCFVGYLVDGQVLRDQNAILRRYVKDTSDFLVSLSQIYIPRYM